MSRQYYKSPFTTDTERNISSKINRISSYLTNNFILNYTFIENPADIETKNILLTRESSDYTIIYYNRHTYDFKKGDLIHVFLECPFRYINNPFVNGFAILKFEVFDNINKSLFWRYDRIVNFNNPYSPYFRKYEMVLNEPSSYLTFNFSIFNDKKWDKTINSFVLMINEKTYKKYNSSSFSVYVYRKNDIDK